MPRRPNIERPVELSLMLPESVRARLDLLLWSEVEHRVPRGAYQRFFVQLINDYFTKLKEDADVLPRDPVPNLQPPP